MSHHIEPTGKQVAAFEVLPSEGIIHVLNFIRLREHAAYPDGRKASGHEAYRAYCQEVDPLLRCSGVRQFCLGSFETMLIGPPTERWDVAFIAEYPDADAFIEAMKDPVYCEAVQHWHAAVEDCRVFRMRPSQTW